MNPFLFALIVLAWSVASGSLNVWLYGSKIQEFWYYSRITSLVYGGLIVVLGITLPYLARCSTGDCTSSAQLEDTWFRLNQLSPSLTSTLVIFLAITSSLGGTIALLDIVPQKLRNAEGPPAHKEEQLLKSVFPESLTKSIKREMQAFEKALSSGDLSGEVEANAIAVRNLLVKIDSLKGNGTRLENSLVAALSNRVLEGVESFQQEVWNKHLTASLHFQLDLVETEVDFGFLRDDEKFGGYTDHSLSSYASFGDAQRIQVRGERVIVGCNVYQITSETKVEVSRCQDEFDTEVIEVSIKGQNWALVLESSDFGVIDLASKGQKEQEDWKVYRSNLYSFVSAVEQVRDALSLVAQQKKNADVQNELKNKYVGARFGDWVGVRPLGNGGFGQVWLATKEPIGSGTSGALAAIKIFTQSDFQSLKQFQAEIASLGRLHHPNIAKLLDHAKTGNLFWFATTYAGEVSIGSLMSSGQLVTRKSLETFAEQLFAALAHAHASQIVHGDVHPGNLVLTDDKSSIVLVDFGLAILGGARTQEILTHREFRAPELLGEHPLVGPKNDVYSAAVTILKMAMETPWHSRKIAPLIRQINSGAPSLGGLDEGIAAFLAPLLSCNPAKRPSSEEIYKHLADGGFHAW